ncbi:hypothetical protein ACFXPY_32385 [Streptomyces sp. NPDC059153]|uniref:hypothetical protein n=1 Tax=unclassified Streptomyces TaxID=2593676 RepID=UPI003682129D
MVTADATADDATVVDAVHDGLAGKSLQPSEHLLDSGYSSAGLLLTAPDDRDIAVVAPVMPNSRSPRSRSLSEWGNRIPR